MQQSSMVSKTFSEHRYGTVSLYPLGKIDLCRGSALRLLLRKSIIQSRMDSRLTLYPMNDEAPSHHRSHDAPVTQES